MSPDLWFYIGLILCLGSTIACLIAGFMGKAPNDITICSVLLLTVFLLVYLVGGFIMQANGNELKGAGWEYYGYLTTAIVLPLGATYFSLLERSRWGSFVLASVGLIVIVMLYRMEQIWYGFGSLNAAMVGAST